MHPFSFLARNAGDPAAAAYAVVRWAGALVLGGLAGCAAVGPDYIPSQVEAPADWRAWHGGSPLLAAPAARSGGDGNAAGQGMPHAGELAFLADPVLADLQARARQANHDLQTAALHFAQSRVQGQMAAAQHQPQVNASTGVNRQRQSESGAATRLLDALAPTNRDELISVLSEPYNLYQAGFDASWEPDLWGRVRRSLEAAQASSTASAALLQEVQLNLAFELARRYVELRGTQRQLRLAQADIAAAQDTLKLLSARTASGLASDLDPTRQQAQLAGLRALLPPLLEQEAQAINQITLLVGERPGALQSELADTGWIPQNLALPDLAPGLPGQVVQRRPDVRAAQARLHAATATIGVAMADLYPRITLGASFGLESVASSKFGEWGSRQWSIGPAISLPIFDQGRRRSTILLRELEQQEAAVVWKQSVLRAWHEIDSALASYAAERLRREQLAHQLHASQTARDLAHAAYIGGLSDFLPELDAQRVLLQAQRDYALSTTRLAVMLIGVYKTLGASYPDPLCPAQARHCPDQTAQDRP